jgi:hypothetical protein
MQARCSATNKDGSPCSAQAWRGGLCRWHDPQLAADRAAWRAKGGQGKGNGVRARRRLAGATMGPAELQGALASVLQGVIAGEVAPGVGSAAAAIARAIVSIREATEIDERLAALERRAGMTGRGRAG